MEIKQELIKREIAGEVLLVPVGKTVLKSNGLFILNELAAFLWDRLADAQTPEELVQAVLDEYDVDAATARADTAEFLETLKNMGIL